MEDLYKDYLAVIQNGKEPPELAKLSPLKAAEEWAKQAGTKEISQHDEEQDRAFLEAFTQNDY